MAASPLTSAVRRPPILAVGFGLLALCTFAPTPAWGQSKKLALLVGCTKFPRASDLPELWGPANDIPLWAGLLRSRFGFADKDITQLVGWPADEAKRPTYRNIAAAFERLIAQAGPDSQVFIVLSGHGTQIPIPATQTDPLDPRNPEPDGLDEVFLPADVEPAGPDGTLKNHLLDDQIGVWLDRLRGRGASVWIIFDCCHSGTMMRGSDERERPREVKAQQLGISEKAIEAAAARGRRAVLLAEKRGERPHENGLFDLKGKSTGKVVAFSAAQAFETAPELAQPPDAPRTPKNVYGLLSYTLVKTIEELQAPVTYRQLARILVARYVAERGSDGPTPQFDGDDLDRQVLGVKHLTTGPEIVLRRNPGELEVSAGDLRGLGRGSVLAVHPPAGDARSPKTVLGYVQITTSQPINAAVQVCPGPRGEPMVPADKLPNLALCTVVSRDLVNRIKLAVRAATKADEPDAAEVRRTLDALDPAVKELVQVTADEAAAEWLAWVEKGRLELRPGAGQRINVGEAAAARKARALRGGPSTPRGFGGYPLADKKQLLRKLEDDLQMIYTGRNLLRIGGSLANSPTQDNFGLRLEILKLKGPRSKEQPDGKLTPGSTLFPGQRLQFTLYNDGPADMWAAVLLMDGNFKIEVLPFALKRGDHYGPVRGTVEGTALGRDCILVLAIPQYRSPDQPDFAFLKQNGLTEHEVKTRGLFRRTRLGAFRDGPTTPFAQLLKAAAGAGRTHAWVRDVPTNPIVLMASWMTLRPSGAQPPPE
jgi:hypothetical protein